MSVPLDVRFLADNLALDFINTSYGIGAGSHDCFTNDKSVVDWLKLAGQLPREFDKAPDGLLVLACELRECARTAIEAAQTGAPADIAVVNDVLERGRSVRELEWDYESRAFKVVKRRRHDDAASLLGPIAESLASLLTSDQFGFVRQCEAHDCVLLFHDLTKSHRRRWCSMATCGNRMKVAAFRARKRNE